jgi:hypothetical protein
LRGAETHADPNDPTGVNLAEITFFLKDRLERLGVAFEPSIGLSWEDKEDVQSLPATAMLERGKAMLQQHLRANVDFSRDFDPHAYLLESDDDYPAALFRRVADAPRLQHFKHKVGSLAGRARFEGANSFERARAATKMRAISVENRR